MKLLVQPDDGLTPILQAIKKAKRLIDIVIFRFDRPEIAKALQAASQTFAADRSPAGPGPSCARVRAPASRSSSSLPWRDGDLAARTSGGEPGGPLITTK